MAAVHNNMTIQEPKKSNQLLVNLTLIGLLGIVCCGVGGGAAWAQAIAPNTAAPVAAPDPLQEAHFSLSLRGAPLPRMLTLLEQTTGLHFRYGAPPDTVVDTSFNNAPLLPTLAALLRNEGFVMQRAGYEVFLFRAAGATPAAQAIPAAWTYWTLPTPPPADWMVGQTLPATGSEPSSSAWQAANVQPVYAHAPGVTVTLPPRAANAANAQLDGPVWLRWPLLLRHLPAGAQLLLETPAGANVYVNGAPLLRRWQGKKLLDLSHVLHVGLNCLALYWPHAPSATPPVTATATPVPPAPALLNYEWFFSTAPVTNAPAPGDQKTPLDTSEF